MNKIPIIFIFKLKFCLLLTKFIVQILALKSKYFSSEHLFLNRTSTASFCVHVRPFKQFFGIKTVDSNRIWTPIVGIEGEHTDHLPNHNIPLSVNFTLFYCAIYNQGFTSRHLRDGSTLQYFYFYSNDKPGLVVTLKLVFSQYAKD